MGTFYVRKASELITRIIKPHDQEESREWSKFYTAWTEIAGDSCSSHSSPIDIRNGIVIIEADHPGWLQRMQFNQNNLLPSIQKRFPVLNIRGIAFKIVGDDSVPMASSTDRNPARQQQPEVPVAEIESSQVEAARAGSVKELIESVQDEGFKNILSSLFSTLQSENRQRKK